MDYPKHLSEKIREEVAVAYLKHELRKIFPSIDIKEIENLMNNKELCTPRDFWNGVHGVGMGFKLHIDFIYLVTAENINWTREKIKVDELSFGIDRETIRLDWVDDKQREFDPIIVVEKENGLTVYEGNGRLNKFLIEKRKEIEAYVGRYTTEVKVPTNYWLPTSVLMDVLFFAYKAVKNKDEVLLSKYAAVINDMIKDSEMGKYEFLNRALTSKKEIREKILGAVKLR